MLISVSRRCDIPRFNFGWFLERLKAAYVEVKNPFNANQVRRVSLLPSDTDAFIFWTRDPRNILNHSAALDPYCYYTMVTLTAYPALLEPNPPPRDEVIAAMGALTEQLGTKRVIWRYDPILLSSLTPAEFHIRNFTALADMLKGIVERVIISLYDGEYGAAKRRIAALESRDLGGGGQSFRMLPTQDGQDLVPETPLLLKALASIAADRGMIIQSCAGAFSIEGIRPGACIDGELLRGLLSAFGSGPGIESAGRDKNQRPLCRCISSVDIGSYGPCPAGCVYCYARRNGD
jgi:hypothetical protein